MKRKAQYKNSYDTKSIDGLALANMRSTRRWKVISPGSSARLSNFSSWRTQRTWRTKYGNFKRPSRSRSSQVSPSIFECDSDATDNCESRYVSIVEVGAHRLSSFRSPVGRRNVNLDIRSGRRANKFGKKVPRLAICTSSLPSPFRHFVRTLPHWPVCTTRLKARILAPGHVPAAILTNCFSCCASRARAHRIRMCVCMLMHKKCTRRYYARASRLRLNREHAFAFRERKRWFKFF